MKNTDMLETQGALFKFIVHLIHNKKSDKLKVTRGEQKQNVL